MVEIELYGESHNIIKVNNITTSEYDYFMFTDYGSNKNGIFIIFSNNLIIHAWYDKNNIWKFEISNEIENCTVKIKPNHNINGIITDVVYISGNIDWVMSSYHKIIRFDNKKG